MQRIGLLIGMLICCSSSGFAQKTFSALDGMTPIGLEPGTAPGSYQLSGLDSLNLYNGSASVRIPLLQIGGRGEAGYTMIATYDAHWEGTGFMSTSDGCSVVAPCPMWAFTATGSSSGVHSYRPAGITIRHLGLHVQPVLNGSSTPFCYANGTTLTRISVSFADGTEMILVDAPTGGTPITSSLSISSCSGQGFDRGTTFISTDGSAARFISDRHIHDVNTPGSSGLPDETAAGTLYLRDGRQFHFGDHHVVPGVPSLTMTVVDRIQDRNGNQTTFNYDAAISGFQTAFTITDPIGRVITVAEGKQFSFSDPACVGECMGSLDQISFGSPDHQKTITVFRRDYWFDRSASLQGSARPTYQDLFGGYASPSTTVFNSAIWKIVLPDNHTYQFYYTQYGEVARLDLPTGGHYEFDWTNGPFTDPFDICLGNPHPGDADNNKCPVIRAPVETQAAFDNTSGYPLLIAVYRRVKERREYVDGGTSWIKRTYYIVDEVAPPQSLEDPLGQCGYTSNINFISGYCSRVTAEDYDPAQGLLTQKIHYFYGAVSRAQSLFPQIGWYSWWLEGKPFRTDIIRPTDGTTLRKQLDTWQPRALPAWWQAQPTKGPQPALDPRIGGSDVIIDGGKMSRTLTVYASDDTNNVVDLSVYDYGSTTGSQGPLVRRSHTDYGANYNDLAAGVYLRNLPSAEIMYDAANNVVTQTQYRYDEGAPLPEPGIMQNVPVPSQRGNLTHVSRWLNTDGIWLTTTRTFDVAGNLISLTMPNGAPTSYTYTDCPGMYSYLSRMTNAAGHSTTFGHNCSLGQVTSITDPNGFVTTAQYNDVLDRLTDVLRPNGQRIRYTYSSDLSSVTTTKDQYENQQIVSSVISDGLGRTIDVRLGNITNKNDLDALGRIRKKYNPGSLIDGITYAYDALGRVSAIMYPDGAAENFDWTGDSVLHTDPASKQIRQQTDALGRLVAVIEDPSSQNPLLTTYVFNALDDLTMVIQGGQTRSFFYDSLKHLRAVINPEIGAVVPGCLGQAVSECYHYDSNGNLDIKTAAGAQTTFQYDSLNRIKKKTYSEGTPEVNYTYDSVQTGCPDSVTTTVAVMAYTAYGPNCTVTASRQTIGPSAYSFSYTYNLDSQLTGETYPSGRIVSYHYDALGRLDRIGNGPLSGSDSYASNIIYTPHGAIEQMTLGVTSTNSGWTESWQYDSKRLQPTSLSVNNGLFNLHFYYCPNGASICTTNNGNMHRQVITRSGVSWTQDFTGYDAMNRLLGAQETSDGGSWSQSFGYDRYGNLWLDNQTGSLPAPTNETPRNATWYLPNNRLAGWGYNDGRGNVTSILNMSRNFSYDGENRQKTATINGAVFTYAYDGEGRRVGKTVAGETITFVYDAFNHLIAEYSTSSSISGTQYVSVDHLGSTRLVTDANGTPIPGGCHDFLPFGGGLAAGINGRGLCYSSTPFSGLGFTGKARDNETGLDFFGVRSYSAAQGRFMATDSISGVPENPQSWNKYAYTFNNPLIYVDPNGKWPTLIHHALFAGAFGGPLGGLTKEQVGLLSRGSDFVDYSISGQTQPSLAYQHGMRSIEERAHEARSRTNSFIDEHEGDAIRWANKLSRVDGWALVEFGMAMHPVMDRTSPAHAGEQLFEGVPSQVSNLMSLTGTLIEITRIEEHQNREAKITRELYRKTVDELRTQYLKTFGKKAYKNATGCEDVANCWHDYSAIPKELWEN